MWSMPRNLRKIAAVVILLMALAGFPVRRPGRPGCRLPAGGSARRRAVDPPAGHRAGGDAPAHRRAAAAG